MKISVISFLFLVKLVSARYAFIPKFFAQDSAVIVDADKPQPNRVQYRPVHYPVYHIIPSVPVATGTHFKEISKAADPVPPVTSTTPATILTKDEFPADLLEIAQKKLGIKSLDEIPSISELGELLGTESAKETIDYIRELTSTEDGIALVKAYIESSDYTDSTGTITSTTSTVAPPTTTTTEMYIHQDITETEPSFFERMSAFLNIFDMFTSGKNNESIEKELQTVDRVSEMGKPIPTSYNNLVHFKPSATAQKPVLPRNPLPYHYPIPIRPVVIYRPRMRAVHAQPSTANSLQSVVHLNTPRLVIPQVSSPVTTTKKVSKSDGTQKQKHFSELAEKITKFPLAHDRDALIDAQYAAAIEKAIEQDEDLRKILSSTETLK